jgi:hypothetical protein
MLEIVGYIRAFVKSPWICAVEGINMTPMATWILLKII